MALTRRPAYANIQPSQPVYLNLSQVTDKQVITRNTGRSLGTMGEAWVDPTRLEVVSFELLETKRSVGGSTATRTIPLQSLKQIGDVVLVQDETAPSSVEQPLDYRYGFIKLLGMEVRSRSGKVLGKVRDIAFNPDSGVISKIEFDDFGLRFLPVNFFDTFSISTELVESCASGVVVVYTEDGQRQEKQGILSNFFRSVGTRPVAGLLSDGGFRNEAANFLPAGYSYSQWEQDIRRWEAETGLRYEDYMAQSQQYGPRGAPRNALPAARMPGAPQAMGGPAAAGGAMGGAQGAASRYALPGPGAAGGAPGGGMQGPGMAARPRPGAPMQPPQQQGYAPAGPLQQQGYAPDPRYRGAAPAAPPAGQRYPAPPQQQAQQPGQWGAAPAPADPRQQQQQQWGQQQQAPQQQQANGWPGPAAPGSQAPPAQRAPAGAAGGPRGPQQGQAYGGPQGGAPGQEPPAAASAAQQGGGSSAEANGAAMRVDEWLSGGRQEGSLVGMAPGGRAPAAEAVGWDGSGAPANNGSRPY